MMKRRFSRIFFLILGCVFFGGSVASADPVIEEAADVWQRDIAYPGALMAVSEKVAPKITLDAVAAAFRKDFSLDPMLTEAVKDVANRVIIDYAASSFQKDLSVDLTLLNAARDVNARVMINYASSGFSRVMLPMHSPGGRLTLPFTDPGVTIQQGWRYTAPIGPNPDDPYAHNGIDYIKGVVNQPATWQPFDVAAAADGAAMRSSGGGYGDFVLIRHNTTDAEGRNYFTLYGHLGGIENHIIYRSDRFAADYQNWTPVARGDRIGVAGSTGVTDAAWIHLHFEVFRGGYAQNKIDPYDIYGARPYYPGGNNYAGIGSAALWLNDPLQEMTEMRDVAHGEIMRVARTGGLGLRLRHSPNLGAAVLTVMPEGSETTVIGGPRHSGGYDWWQIRYDGREGWAAGLYLVKAEGYDSPDNPTGLRQYRADGSLMSAGEEIYENRVILKGGVSDPGGEPVKLQVEVRPVNEAFRRYTHEGSLTAGGAESVVTVADLPNETYHWRARTVTANGMTSDWVLFSQEPADFVIARKLTPKAIINHEPSYPLDGEIVYFDADASAPSSDIISYEWDFGNGEYASGKAIARSFPTGIHHVSLHIVTASGLSHTCHQEIQVAGRELADSINSIADRAIANIQNIVADSEKVAQATDYYSKRIDGVAGKIVAKAVLDILFASMEIEGLIRTDAYYDFFEEIGFSLLYAKNIMHKISDAAAEALVDNYKNHDGKMQTDLLQGLAENYIQKIENKRMEILQSLPYLDEEQTEVILDRLRRIEFGFVSLDAYRLNKVNFFMTYQLMAEFDEKYLWYKVFNITFNASAGTLVGIIATKAAPAIGISNAALATIVPSSIKLTPKIVSVAKTAFETVSNARAAEAMFATGLAILMDNTSQAETVFRGTLQGFEDIKTIANAHPGIYKAYNAPRGTIGRDVRHVKEGKRNWRNQFIAENVYSEFVLKNTGDKTASYRLHVVHEHEEIISRHLWGLHKKKHKLPKIVLDLSVVLEEEEEHLVKVEYVKDGKGKIPNDVALNFMILEDNKDFPVFGGGVEFHNVNTIYIENGVELTEEEVNNLIGVIEPPLYAQIFPVVEDAGNFPEKYIVRLFLENNFEQPTKFSITQPIPEDIVFIESDGFYADDSQVYWEFDLAPNERETMEVYIQTSDLRLVPPAIVEVYDNIADDWFPLTGAVFLDYSVFQDVVLSGELADILNKSIDAIHYTDLLDLIELDLSGKNITSLIGLEWAHNLRCLDVSANLLTALFPLRSHSGLEALDASDNMIADLSGVENLLSLHHLNLSGNKIADISALVENCQAGGLGEGDYVDLRHNYLDLAPGSEALADIQMLIAHGVMVEYEPQVSLPGDVNGDGVVDMADALAALQIAAGIYSGAINMDADVNDDGSIGMAEAIYVIETAAGVR